jgi:release factor glutamine methyltransferase
LVACSTYSGLKIKLCEGVYAPAEDSFLLAENLVVESGERVLDMGTGTGLLGLLAAKSANYVIGVDLNQLAIECARVNAKINNIRKFTTRTSDLFSHVPESFDLIIFNPPYLPTEDWEPKDEETISWAGGRSGREVIDRFLKKAKDHLVRSGRVLMVGSSLSDYEKTLRILEGQGFEISLLASKKLDFEELVVIKANYNF